MLHLLTEEHKKKVTTEYNRRVGIVISAVAVILSVASVAMLLPSYLMVHSRYAEAQAEKQDVEGKIAARQNDTSATSIQSVTTSIAALRMFSTKVEPSVLMVRLVADKPRGVSITHIAYVPQNPGQSASSSLEIVGRSDTRSDLVLFSQQVKSDRAFSGIDVPLSSFARDTNIDFTMKATVSSSFDASSASSSAEKNNGK